MRQLELFDEDGEIFCEEYIRVGGVEYVPRILHPGNTVNACDDCEFAAFVHPCMKARCIPGERQDQQGCLQTVFKDGKAYNVQSLDEIRNRINSSLT